MPLRLLAFLSAVLLSFIPVNAKGASISLIHIVIVADLSDSMFEVHATAQGPQSHADLQTAALHQFFVSLPVTFCEPIKIDFAPWNDKPLGQAVALIKTNDDAERFADDVRRRSKTLWGATRPEIGIRNGLRLLDETRAAHQVLIFTTDGLPPYELKGRIVPIPDHVNVYGISLSTKAVHDFITINVVPPTGKVFQVDNVEEFVAVLRQVFDDLNLDPCLG